MKFSSAFLLVTTAAFSSTLAAPTITDLGGMSGAAYSYARGVSADGTTVVGFTNTLAIRPFRWRASTGMIDLAPDRSIAQAVAVSADGSVVVGNSGGAMIKWSLANPGISSVLPFCADAYNAFSYGVDASGAHIVGGSGTNHGSAAVLYSGSSTDVLPLPNDALVNGAGANGISQDGQWIVGYLSRPPYSKPARWYNGTDPTQLPLPANATNSTAWAVSNHGEVIVGECTYPSGTRACQWNTAGVFEDLWVVSGASDSVAYAVNADGSTIVGTSGSHAFIWRRDTGIMKLRDFLIANGLNPVGWTLMEARGVSADGSVIVGSGSINSANHAFIITGLPPSFKPCAPDFNGDGFLDIHDFDAFVAAFEEGAARSDFNSDGFLDFTDFDQFVVTFESGC